MSLLLFAALLLGPSADVAVDLHPVLAGRAFQYHPHVMERVAAKRGLGWVSGMAGWVSDLNCARVGQMVHARIGNETGWYRVADCSNPKDLRAQRRKGEVLETSFPIAYRGGWDTYRLDGPGHTRAVIYGYRRPW